MSGAPGSPSSGLAEGWLAAPSASGLFGKSGTFVQAPSAITASSAHASKARTKTADLGEGDNLRPHDRGAGNDHGLVWWRITIPAERDDVLVRRKHDRVVGDPHTIAIGEDITVVLVGDQKVFN